MLVPQIFHACRRWIRIPFLAGLRAAKSPDSVCRNQGRNPAEDGSESTPRLAVPGQGPRVRLERRSTLRGAARFASRFESRGESFPVHGSEATTTTLRPRSG